jgi:hypothetical protein
MGFLRKVLLLPLLFVCGWAMPGLALSKPEVFLDSNSDIVAVWADYESESPVFRVNTKLIAGLWGTKQTITAPGDIGSYQIKSLSAGLFDVAVVILWVGTNGDIRSLYSAMRPLLLDSWTITQVSGPTENVVDPDFILNLSPLGVVSAIWKSNESGIDQISYSVATAFTNVWSAPTVISD